ncbi:MAG TPA: type III pantothenate kinase [Luteimonas sp.]|nr:type III pantothenate kinase [Luteimonas sp.]
MTGAPTSEWLFDLGNSRLKFAPVVEGQVGEVRSVAHAGGRLPRGWDAALPERFEAAWIASVAAAPVRDALRDALAARARHLQHASTLPACAGVRIAYARPERLGVDRFLSLLGAHARSAGRPCLVVGVGTALTVDLLEGDGRHRGGRIAPSPTLMREALHARAAQLPVEGGAHTDFASDTGDALASGCEGAALGLVRDSLGSARALLGEAPALLVHGGGAAPLLPRLADALHAPALVLEGLLQFRIAAC